MGTSEPNLDLSYQPTQTGEGKTPSSRVGAAQDVKGMTNPRPKGGQGRNESLSPTPGGVTGGQLLLSPEPPKRPESPLVAQYKDLRKTAPVDRHEVQASRAQSRREEQRTITVNWVRGDLVREAAQEIQSKELSKGPRNRGYKTDVSNNAPTQVSPQEEGENPGTPDTGGGADIRGLEGPLPMELE